MTALRLLLIEDSPDDEKLVLREFKKAKYELNYTCVQTAEALTEALQTSLWDIVISDFHMPAFNGVEALEIVKQSGLEIPFIIVSGAIGEDTAVEAMRAGADDYIMKFNLRRLMPAVERSLREAENRRQRTQAESELNQLRLQLEGIISSAMDAIITIDETYKILLCNKAAREMFGYSSDLVGKSINELIPERFRQSHNRHVAEFGASGKTNRMMGMNMTIYGIHANGNEFPIEASISQVDNGKRKLFTVILRDITMRVKAEQQEKQLNMELISQNEQLQQFGYITSHNIRGPVATLLGLVAIYNPDQPQSLQNAYVISQIGQTVQKLDTVIKDLNQILEYKNQLNTIRENVLLSETLEDVKNEIASLISTSPCTITADFSQVNEVYTVKSYLHSIFHNLLSNAIKYRNPRKAAHIHIGSQVKEDAIYISFKDNGLGIDLSRYKNNLFGLYKRFHLQVEGKGLGLHLVKTQITALNGKIEVDSKPDEGSTFTIILPKAT